MILNRSEQDPEVKSLVLCIPFHYFSDPVPSLLPQLLCFFAQPLVHFTWKVQNHGFVP